MTEISIVKLVPQVKVIELDGPNEKSKVYLLKKTANDLVTIENKEKKGGGIGKGILSYMFPGLGELIDGRIGAGLTTIGAMFGLGTIGQALLKKPTLDYLQKHFSGDVASEFSKLTKGNIKNVVKDVLGHAKKIFKTLPKSTKIGVLALSGATFATRIFSAINATKHLNGNYVYTDK